MSKLGLLLELIGFLMLFWKVEVRPNQSIEKGGGVTQHQFEEQMQIEKSLDWLSHEGIRKWLSKHFTRIALGFVVIGVLFQLISCG
jgi:hypothetical protein